MSESENDHSSDGDCFLESSDSEPERCDSDPDIVQPSLQARVFIVGFWKLKKAFPVFVFWFVIAIPSLTVRHFVSTNFVQRYA